MISWSTYAFIYVGWATVGYSYHIAHNISMYMAGVVQLYRSHHREYLWSHTLRGISATSEAIYIYTMASVRIYGKMQAPPPIRVVTSWKYGCLPARVRCGCPPSGDLLGHKCSFSIFGCKRASMAAPSRLLLQRHSCDRWQYRVPVYRRRSRREEWDAAGRLSSI